MSKTVIVTGGCGYIGSHVARAFKYENPDNRVFVIDRVLREHTLKGLDGFFINDFASDEALATIIDLQPDVIVHCAGTSLVGPSVSNPSEYYNNNINKTVKLLDAIKDLEKKPLFMFSSSASVYGNPKRLPINELDPKEPISPYGNTKFMTELMLRDYFKAYGLNSICFRYFNAAGAEPINHDLGQEPGATHIIARALEASLSGDTFKLNGVDFPTRDGSCIRDYVHVWDIACAHIKGAEFYDKMDKNSSAAAMVFNLGSDSGVSNFEILQHVKTRYGLNIMFGAARPGDPAELVADAHAVKDILGWEPRFSDIETIIDSAYKWYTRQ